MVLATIITMEHRRSSLSVPVVLFVWAVMNINAPPVFHYVTNMFIKYLDRILRDPGCNQGSNKVQCKVYNLQYFIELKLSFLKAGICQVRILVDILLKALLMYNVH